MFFKKSCPKFKIGDIVYLIPLDYFQYTVVHVNKKKFLFITYYEYDLVNKGSHHFISIPGCEEKYLSYAEPQMNTKLGSLW